MRVSVFADAPHLLKLIRNNFLDHGFKVNDVNIGKDYIEKLSLLNKSELDIVHKLEQMHSDVKSSERQKLRPAA